MGYETDWIRKCEICNRKHKVYCSECYDKHCKNDITHKRRQRAITIKEYAEEYDDHYTFQKTCKSYRLC